MPYVEGRTVHDADSHIFEPPGYAEDHADPKFRDALRAALKADERPEFLDKVLAKQDDPEFRAKDAEEILLRKNHVALGAMRNADRPHALDLLGFASQLVFTTSYLGALLRFDRGDDVDLAYALATGHNRGIVEFCSVDRRLLPVCYIPFTDVDRAADAAREALDLGASALMIASMPPRDHSPSHVGFDRVWAQAQEAGVPIVFHVGGEKPMEPVYKQNGLPPVPDFHGGDANFTSVSYMAIPYAPMQTVATLIIDGVLERFPSLRIGLIELGASWVPGWMRSMDSAAEAFRRNEERLQKASLKPSEYVRRQVRVTPYPHESAGWLVREAGAEVPLFSSDYPHVEGGRNPLKRFESSLEAEGCTATQKDAFYRANFEDLMGPALDRIREPVGA
ncbi:MAG TPA: amidohydrolase family protein [Acidimicrobiales bacterium]|nr:amidohydrolase family protein [Acidimicrobiales bacterium]